MLALAAFIVASATIALGCDARQLTLPMPSSSASIPSPAASPDPLDAAIAFRTSFGLRADEAYVRELTRDSAAAARADFAGFPFPMTASEVLDLQRRSRDFSEIATEAAAYGRLHPADFAGGYVDTANHRYVFLVKDNGEMHRAALSSQVPAGSPIAVVQVRWTLAEMEPIVERINDDAAFFVDLGVHFGAGVVQRDNIVEILVSATDPAVEAVVLDRYDRDPRIRVRMAGHGLWQGAYGTVIVRVTDGTGRSISAEGVACWLVADDPRAWSPDEPERIPIDGLCQFGHVGATGVEAQLREDSGDRRVVGSSRAFVPANGTVVITVVFKENPE